MGNFGEKGGGLTIKKVMHLKTRGGRETTWSQERETVKRNSVGI